MDSDKPDILANALNNARKSMRAHPEYQLLPRHRRSIYDALKAPQFSGVSNLEGELALHTAQRVLPLYQDTIKDIFTDLRPEAMLDTAERVLLRKIDTHQGQNLARSIWLKLEQLATSDFGETTSFLVVLAAHSALLEALKRDPFSAVVIDEFDNDAQLDPWCSDTAKYAAAAYSGVVWIAQTSYARRQEFWEWWLEEAARVAERGLNKQ
ncbi:MAG: Imm5 family immunity protein [Anaerolineales bacterium]